MWLKKVDKRIWTAGSIILALVLICFSLLSLRYRLGSPNQPADISGYTTHGIDLSSHNGDVNFDKVKASGIGFALLKASEGGDFRDKNFTRNYNAAKASGLAVGTYHFFRFDVDGITQAQNFLSIIGNRQFDFPLVIDIEEHGNPYVFIKSKVVRRLKDMIDYMTIKGYKVMIYTNEHGYHKFIKNRFDKFPLWICTFSLPKMKWTIWQYSHRGSVPGIEGDVDLNVLYNKKQDRLVQ